MTDKTTENFWQAWNQPWPEPKAVFYRLYYDQQGYPTCYSMEDLPGTYIEIDQATYAQSLINVRVINGQIQCQKSVTKISKLQPSDTGVACHPQDICVIVDTKQPHTNWNTTHHEIS